MTRRDEIYATGVLAYREAGWPGVIPAWGPGDKRPVRGFTGDKNYGVYPDDNQIVWWAAHDAGSNLLLRVTPTLIGLDKDAYGDKSGDKTMAEAENRWGPLPADAWRSTSRIDCPNGSGIYLFKVPDGWRGRGEISFSELAIGDVEIIQHHHRTICAWPSVHPISGGTYRWFDRTGELVPEGVVPAADDHPELPLEWLKGLANTKANRSRELRRKDNRPDDNDLPLADVSALLTDGRMTKDVAARFGQALYAITDGSDRHRSTLRHTLALLGMGAAGQAGVGYAVRELNKSFVAVVGPTRDHGENEADEEFSRMIHGAGRLLDEGEEEADVSSETPDPQNPATAATAQQSWSGPPPAVALLHDILQEAHEDVRKLGVAGEETTVKSVFLAVVSRLLDTPVSVAIKGNSASGKSWIVKKVLRLFPDAAYFARSAMSSKALIYSAESYEHRMIVLYEVTGMRENNDDDMTAYLVRTLLSEGRLDYEVTVKDQTGNPTTVHIVKEGPTGLIFTTTQATVHHENETRLLSLNTDDTNEQTTRVMMRLASEAVDDVDLGRWHDLQHWLADDATEKRVTVPFATDLARLVPPVAVRMRRDFGAVLALIRAHAVLHQLNRSRDAQGRIVATAGEDYAVVRELVSSAVSQGLGTTVSAAVRETVAAVKTLALETLVGGVSTTAVAKHLKVHKATASRRLKLALDGGYIENQLPKPGVPDRWVKGEELPSERDVLPTVAQLLRQVLRSDSPSDQDCCAVAPNPGVRKQNERNLTAADRTPPTPHLANDAAAAEEPLQTVVHERIKGVIIRRLTKVHTATRAELKQSLESKHRPSFDEVFDALVTDDDLVVADEGAKTTRWSLASPEQRTDR